ncbi:MAG: nitroreductase family protein, partial [Clostridia bacterium]|nr:nitroreductase family protein [Clostridia bacterium]
CRDYKTLEEFIPTKEQITDLLEAGRICPTARNYQSQRIFVVTKQEDLKKIDKATQCRFNAPVVFIFGFDNTVAAQHDRWAGEKWDFGRDDLNSALVHMMLKATDMGLATCWVGAFEEATIRQEFNLPSNITIRALLDFGYATKDKGQPGPMHTKREPLNQTCKWL